MKWSVLFSLLLFASQISAHSTEKKVLILETLSVPVVTSHTQIITNTLNHLAPNLAVNVFDGQGQSHIMEKFLAEQIACRCFDVLITNGTLASKVGKKMLAEQATPMVFVIVADPVGSGLVDKVGQPSGSFVTGRVQSVRRGAKLEIASKLIGGKEVNIGLVSTSYPSALSDIDKIQSLAKGYPNIELTKRIIPYNDSSHKAMKKTYSDAFHVARTLEPVVDYFWSINGPFSERGDFVSQIKQVKPVFYGANVTSVKAGALFTVIPDPMSTSFEVAQIVLDILQGKNPGEITVRPASENVIAFNLTTALELGIVIPFELMDLAGKNIYR